MTASDDAGRWRSDAGPDQSPSTRNDPGRVVVLGASAGGVEALEAFFKAVPGDNGMAFVVVTHLDPNRESMLAEILGRATRMPVVNALDGEPVAAEHVYVLPAGAILTARKARLQVRAVGSHDRERAPIDLFFASLAEDQREHAIAIVLSGSGKSWPTRINGLEKSPAERRSAPDRGEYRQTARSC